MRLDPRALVTTMLLLATALATAHLYEPIIAAFSLGGIEHEFRRLILLHATLPRMAIALLCGAGLATSGAILQQVLRNPLASPDTVGVSAGARLALALATLFAPGLFGFGRDLVAIGGALVSTLVVLFIARTRRYSPLSLILAGLVVSLYCGAAATILVLVKDRYLVGLFIWGSGSLSQQSWGPSIHLATRLAVCSLPLALLMRPLSVLDAGEEVARSLGVSVERTRLLSIGVAVLMSAFVASTVGVIGFIGLAAPVLATLCGVRGFRARCLWSAAIGALLLLVTDLAVQLLGGNGAAFIPSGAVTAVIGSPLLLVLLSRLRSSTSHALASASAPLFPARWKAWGLPWRTLSCLGLLVALGGLVFVGRDPGGGWWLLRADQFPDVLPWRLPRMLAAAGAGGLLAAAGYALQRVTRNPMASPEIMGVSAGAVLGAAVVLFVGGHASQASLTISAAVGSLVALLFVLGVSMRGSASPERVLLAGVALTALVDALVGLLMATGSPSSVMLLAWIAGSANGVSLPLAAGVVGSTVLLTAIALLATRWLSILPLGMQTAKSVGVPVPAAQTSLLILVAVMTAVATPVIGPLTFVGLMAPHVVGLLGIRSVPAGLALSTVAGMAFMMLADTLARTIAFPLQLPTGILASLLAGPFLLLLISSGGKWTATRPTP